MKTQEPPPRKTKYDILYLPYVVRAYVDRLPPKERKAYEIAKSHLGCSYQTEKSVHYEKWLNKIVTKMNKVVRGFIVRRKYKKPQESKPPESKPKIVRKVIKHKTKS